jgi:thiazole synthase
MEDYLEIAGKRFRSRLLVGTGKYRTPEEMVAAIGASGAEIVTVAIRRLDIDKPDQKTLLDYIDWSRYTILPNTAACRTVEEALFTARLGREVTGSTWVKLEVVPDPKYLLPDPVGTLEAAKVLLNEGFVVLPYIHADPVLARRLEEIGCATVMPLGSAIGSGQGILTLEEIQIIVEQANVPVIVDAGLGAPSDAALAMEVGADAVLMNTALAEAGDPALMADAIRKGLEKHADWEEGYVQLGSLLTGSGKSDEARQALATGLSKLPRSVAIRTALATVEMQALRVQVSKQILEPLAQEFDAQYGTGPEKVDRLRPYIGAIRLYSLACYLLNQNDEALQWGLKVWQVEPTDVANTNNVAWILATVYKDYKRATDMVDLALRLTPNHPQVLDTKGWIAFLSGNYQESADNLLASLKYGETAIAHYHLGRLYEVRDRPRDARTEYEKALQLKLPDEETRDAQRRLERLPKT